MRIFGDNSAGFENETKIVKALNFKKFEQLNPNLRKFVSDAFYGYDVKNKIIHAIETGNTGRQKAKPKPDFYLHIDGINKDIYVSVKVGGGNSIHQEKLETFCEYIKNLGANDELLYQLRLFHYSDGTADNTGKIRLGARDFEKENPNIVESLNAFFNNQKIYKNLINRFVFQGVDEDLPKADYFYHGTQNNGVWASRDELMDYFISNCPTNPKSVIINNLSYQTWNKNINFNPKTEDRRYSMQVKFSKSEKILLEIMTNKVAKNKQKTTQDGNISEIQNVILFNKDPQNDIFSNFIKKISQKNQIQNILLVRVDKKHNSKLSKKTVMSRADAFAIYVKNDKLFEILQENDFYLDESILQYYKDFFEIIPKSGISIKLNSSNDYTILKMTPKSFETLFSPFLKNTNEIGASASLFCQNLDELHKNADLVKGWGAKIDKIGDEFLFVNRDKIVSSTKICEYLKKNRC